MITEEREYSEETVESSSLPKWFQWAQAIVVIVTAITVSVAAGLTSKRYLNNNPAK